MTPIENQLCLYVLPRQILYPILLKLDTDVVKMAGVSKKFRNLVFSIEFFNTYIKYHKIDIKYPKIDVSCSSELITVRALFRHIVIGHKRIYKNLKEIVNIFNPLKPIGQRSFYNIQTGQIVLRELMSEEAFLRTFYVAAPRYTHFDENNAHKIKCMELKKSKIPSFGFLFGSSYRYDPIANCSLTETNREIDSLHRRELSLVEKVVTETFEAPNCNVHTFEEILDEKYDSAMLEFTR